MAYVVNAASRGNVGHTLNSIIDVADSFISESLAATVVLVDGHVSSGLRLAACRGLSRDFEDAMERDPEQFRARYPPAQSVSSGPSWPRTSSATQPTADSGGLPALRDTSRCWPRP